MKTILVPLDGSACAEQVLPFVRLLAPMLKARIHFLRVLAENDSSRALAESFAMMSGVFPPAPSQASTQRALPSASGQRAAEYLADQADALRDTGVPFDVDVRVGQPADVIVEVAEHEKVDLIAMATHGYSGLRRWTLGSVTDKVIHATTRPLLLVRGTATVPARPTFRNIIVPLDGSALAEQALPYATELAKLAGSNLLLLRAVLPALDIYPDGRFVGTRLPTFPDVLAALQEQANDMLELTAAPLRDQHLKVATYVATGFPAEVIVDEAERRQIDLIVMATHGYSGLRRWAIGSVADKVIHATTTPLLLVRSS